MSFGVCAGAVLLAAAPGRAAAAAKARELPGEAVEFKTEDGWTLKGEYFPSKEEDKLTFILLHEARGRRQNWYWLARRLSQRGIGYLAMDLRGHGASQNPPEGQPASWRKFRPVTKHYNEYDNMRGDIAAAVSYLAGRGVPEESVALGGSETGGAVALKYAALHPVVPMLFWLSPGMSYHEVLTVNAMRAYRDRPILLVVAEDDRRSSTESTILHGFAKGAAGEENARLLRVAKGHGTRMLYYNKDLIEQVLDWIDDPVRPPEMSISTGTFENMDGTPPTDAEGGALPGEASLDRMIGGGALPPFE